MTIKSRTLTSSGSSSEWRVEVQCDGDGCDTGITLGGTVSSLAVMTAAVYEDRIRPMLEDEGWQIVRGRHLCPPPR